MRPFHARLPLVLCGMFAFHLALWAAAPARITIQADKPGPAINPAMWGLFFEDINFGADGGLYAELVKNRSFEFPHALMGWTIYSPGIGSVTIQADGSSPNNDSYLRLTSATAKGYGIVNEGFRGMGVRQGEKYQFSANVRGGKGLRVRVELVNARRQVIASTRLNGVTAEWQEQRAVLELSTTEAKAVLRVILEGKGTVDLDMISLFPAKTWKNRSGGLRADVVQMLADMRPGFLRFPGGCIVEGNYLTNRYQWKTTIGPASDRQLIINRWNIEFKHRPAPDYYQTFGLGFFEYFQLCEDIGAQPLPILNCGMACQFNSKELTPLHQLQPYIQDALDLIEFANGPAETAWGAKRAAMGHPRPFGMKLLGVGNEQWGQEYIDRYIPFAKALKEKYPEVQLIASAGPAPADDRFRFLSQKLRELKADIVDEHCYAAPQWFFDSTRRYDDYDRHGPRIFMGEYAAQTVAIASPNNRNTLLTALSEAAYMTGMERNADVVRLAAYAPLSAHVDAWQWTPNLIWFDNLRVYGTPNYYVQSLFSQNRGDLVLPLAISGADTGLYASATHDKKADEVIVKIVNPAESRPVDVQFAGLSGTTTGKAIVLSGASLDLENSLDEPTRLAPATSKLPAFSSTLTYTLQPHSLTVLRIPLP